MKIKIIQHELVVSPKIKKLNYSDVYIIKIKKKIKYKILLVSGGLINPNKALGDRYIPTGVQASYGTYTDKIALNWNTVSGVNGYYIYRDSALIGSTTTNYFNDTDSLYGKLFTYNIRSFVNDSGNIITTRNSASVQGWKKLIPPTNLTVSDGVYTDKIVLTWSSVSGATAYKLYRYNDSDPSPVLTYFTSTVNTSYNDTGVSYGARYYYAVKASCSLGDSEFSDSVIGSLDSTIPDAPLSVAASDGVYTDKIKIVWSTTPRATNYNIYRELNNTTTRINSGVRGISFEDTTALSGITYNYSVSASNLAGEGPVSSKNSGWIKLNIPTGLVATDRTYTDRINISWNAVQGATAYKLYKDTNLLTTTTNTQYDDTSVVFGQNYMYSVKASSALGDSDISVEDQGTVAQPVPSSIVTGVTASNALYTDKITVTWNAVSPSGISGYNIYRNSAYNQRIAINPSSPSTYSIEDTAITPGVLYGYSVKIYNRAGEGPVSSGATGWAKLAAPETLHASDALFSDRVRLNWASVNGATLYKMFRGTPTLSLLGTTTNTTYDDFSAVYGQTYTYAIRASCTLGDSDYSPTDFGSLSAAPLVPPEAFVTNISASRGVWSDRIILSWTAVSGISGYNIYRNSSYRGNVTSTSFVDFSVNPGVLYEYKVNVTNPAGEGPLSSGVTGWATIIAPTAFSASDDDYDDKIRLNWNTVSGATAYKIYKGSPLELLDVTTNSQYDDFTPTFGQVYNYGVAASCALVDTSIVTDTGRVAQPVPATPTGVNATDGTFTDKIQITWNSVPGISGYRVNRNGSQIGGTVVTTFDDTSAGAGISFNYSVVAFNKRTSGPTSGIDYGFRGIATPTDFAASNAQFTDRVRLSWSGINGATAYFVYKGDDLESLIGSTVGTEFYDLSVTAGQVYNYAVKPSCLLQTGQTSNSDTGYLILPPPTGVSASDKTYDDRIRTIWNAVSGASGYKVYRNSETSSVIVGTTIGTLFDDYSAIAGVSYNIFVTSYNKVPSGTNESLPSNSDFGSVGLTASIYVSTGGNDNNTGKLPIDGLTGGPVATLTKAVQLATASPEQFVQIILRGGIYKILGTPLNPALYLEGVTKSITFKNYNSETVIISGSEDVPYTRFSLLNSTDSNWNRFKPEVTNNIYVADVSDFDLGVFPTNWRGKRVTGGDNGKIPDFPGVPWLVYNNQIMTLARWPNKTGITSSGYSYSECATISNSPNSIISTAPYDYNIFKYRDEYDTTIQRWVNNGAIASGAWINIFGYYDWVSETVKVAGITLSSAVNSGFTAAIKLDMRSSAYGIQNNSLCNGGITYANATPRRWFIQNIIDELDTPGEYYIDRNNKKLYFYPPTPIGATCSVLLTHRATYGPAALEADQPLKMTYERGYNSSSGNAVYNAAVGNTFGYYPYEGWTGSYIKNVGYANSAGLIQSRYPWNTVATIDSVFKFYKTKNVNIDGLIFKNCSGSAIKLELCENITVKNCSVYNIKKNAVRSLGGKNIKIQNCLIQDIGSDAVINVGGNRRTLEYGNNTVTGCLIKRWGTNGPDQGNAVVINGCGNSVSYNLFDNGSGKAIENNNSNYNTIEYNYFNNIVTDTDDQGAIYSYASKSSFGNTIRYNFFDNIGTKLPGGIGYVNRPWPNIGDANYNGCTGPITNITPAIYIDGYENFVNIYSNTFYRCKNPGGCIYSAGTLHTVTNNIFVDSTAGMSITRPSYDTINSTYSSFLEAQKTLNLFNDPWLEEGAGYSLGQLQISTGYGPWNSFVSNFGEDYYLIYDNNNGYTGSKGMMNVVDITTPTWQQAEPRLNQLIGITGSGVNRRLGLSLGYASDAKITYTNNLVTGCCGSYWIGATGSFSLPSNPLIGGFSGADNNMVTSGFTGFTNKQNLNFKLTTKGLTDIQAVIPQFQNVPFESIPGISYNPITTTETVYTPNTQTWYVPGITNANPDAGNYASIHVGHSPVVFYTTVDGTVGYITRDITRIFNLNVDLTPPANVGKCKQIVVGYQCVTALRTDGTLVSWGKINGSTIELAAQTDWFQQQLTQKGRTVKKIAGGAGHVLALLDTGEVVAWGSNEAAQLSDPNTVWSYIGLIPRPTATDHKYLTGFTAYASQEYLQDASSYLVTLSAPNACVPVVDPSLRYRQFRSLNPGCTLHATFPQGGYDTPYVFNGITYPGPEFTPGFSWKGKINWRPITGAPYDYQFSRQTTGDTLSVNYSRKGGWTQGTEHIPVNDSATQVYNYLPNSVFGTAGITYVDIAANRSNSIALTSEGTIQIWGWNWYYNVTGSGDESENGASGWSRTGAGTSGGGPGGGWDSASAYIPAKPRPIPDAPSGDKTATTVKTLKTTPNSVSKIGVGYYTQYVIKSDGSLFAWDRNEWGETTPRTNSDGTSGLPTGPFTQVCGGYHHSIALRQNGTVVCWGENNDGECNVPPNLTDVVWVGASYRMSFALKSDGTLIGWGGLDNFIANPGLGVNPPAPEQQPALNLFVGTWFEIPGASSLTNITPFTWVSYNDILDINNITTTIETPAAISSRLQQIPVGRRILAPRRYWGPRSVWGATTDNIPSKSIPGITNVTPWADTAIKGLTSEWNPWMDSLVSLGTTFDFLIHGQENQYVISSYDPNFTEKLRGYTSDTRYTQAKYGISSLSDLLSGITISNVTQLAYSSGMEYIAFNKVIGQYGAAVLNRALWDYSKQKLPNLRGSNYHGYLSTVNPAPDANGHPQAHDERFGTASAPDMYAMQAQLNTAWYVNKTNPTQLIFKYTAPGDYTDADLIPRTVWSGFIQAQQVARSVRRSDASKGFHPWIATPGYTGDFTTIPVLYPSDDRYYYESIRHLGLLGAEVILYWNPPGPGGLSLTYATKINSVVDELATKFNNKKIIQTVPSGLTAISWNADYITTGSVLANNTYLWRTTFKNDVIRVINDTTGMTYVMGGSTCGVWDTSTTNTLPSYTIIKEIPVIQNYASYNLRNTTTLASTTGCTTRFGAPTYVFPSWDYDIKLIPGISFGKITINDFKYLQGITNPNSGISPC